MTITGPWTLADLRAGKIGDPKNGLRVVSTFACGGGSTMGWKLAGFDVVAAVEIDKKMADIYQKNHKPKFLFTQSIQEFNARDDIPGELYGIDVLDGSPPCSVFSTAGNREKDWNKERVFREGQAKQRLDDLFFHFVDTVKKLRPRIAVAENVKGLVLGNARGYVKEIFKAFNDAGYDTQLFLLNSSRMGVPQRRERTFFIARRKQSNIAPVHLCPEEPEIPLLTALQGVKRTFDHKVPSELVQELWGLTTPGSNVNIAAKKAGVACGFCTSRVHANRPSRTVTANSDGLLHWGECRSFDSAELCRIQTFPDDYDFGRQKAGYVCGMSVPPFMMQRIGSVIASALLNAPGGSAKDEPKSVARAPVQKGKQARRAKA